MQAARDVAAIVRGNLIFALTYNFAAVGAALAGLMQLRKVVYADARLDITSAVTQLPPNSPPRYRIGFLPLTPAQ